MSEVRLADLWDMLNDCAPGYTKEQRSRNWCVRYNGNEYPQVPLGAPGEKRPGIKRGTVRHLANKLMLKPGCVNRHFPGLMKE